VKPEKAQNEQDDDHQADEIDDAVHGALVSRVTIHPRIVRVQIKGLRKRRYAARRSSLPFIISDWVNAVND
jgi:hypothetical protein